MKWEVKGEPEVLSRGSQGDEQLLVHKEKGQTLSLEEMQGVVDGQALRFSVRGETWNTECYWFAAPTAIGFEPFDLWFP